MPPTDAQRARTEERRRRDFIQLQRDLAQADHDSQVALSKIQGVKNVCYILAGTAPMYFVFRTFDVLAGQKTEFTGTVQISLAVSLVLGGAWANERRRSVSQRKELERVRKRQTQLESTVQELSRESETT